MTDWSLMEREWLTATEPVPYDPYQFAEYDPYSCEKQLSLPHQPPTTSLPLPPLQQKNSLQEMKQQKQSVDQSEPPPAPSSSSLTPSLTMLLSSPQQLSLPGMSLLQHLPPPKPYLSALPKVETPRELRNKAEKQRRDKLNQSIAELASLVPPIVYSGRKIDKTSVLRYTAHYLRAHQYVFGSSTPDGAQFSDSSTQTVIGLLNGFMLTTTYKGLVVVVSPNITEFLGYTELELLGKSIFSIIHEDDRELFRDQLMPRSQKMGKNGELLVPPEEGSRQRAAEALANEKRSFIVRFIKLGQRSEPTKYAVCHVEGSLRMSDRACRGYTRCCQMRRVRARAENPWSSGNDVVFIGVVRPSAETFINESALESYKMEYKTRHSIDGEIIQCEHRISLVTGYMTTEVHGVNAMNFIHRDEVRWVIVALKEMYCTNQMYGESCYRLMTKTGQFVYMRTRGKLDVDVGASAVTSFVCTNTVVEEEEGKHFIKLMKDRFTVVFKKTETHYGDDFNETSENEGISRTLEHPRRLKKEILDMVTDLPQAENGNPQGRASGRMEHPRFAIIAPKKERIVSAIEKIYTVFTSMSKHSSILQDRRIAEDTAQVPFVPAMGAGSGLPQLPPISEFDYPSAPKAEFVSNTAYIPTSSSDFELMPEIGMAGLSHKASSVAYSNFVSVNYTEMESKFQMYSPTTLDAATGSHQIGEGMLPNLNAAGVKRANVFDNQETAKKKVIDSFNENMTANEESLDLECPALETFFDEAALFNQIQSAMDSMEGTIDPSFPDFLISEEVDELLKNIDGTVRGGQDEEPFNGEQFI